MDILRVLVVSYLIATLSATGLAKLINRRTASVGMAREGVLSSRFALPVILAVAIAELSLAVLLTLGIYQEIVAFVCGSLFVTFAAYRIAVAVKVHAVVCACAGAVRTDPASLPAVAGAVLACAFLGALACSVPFLSQPSGYPLMLIAVSALTLPTASAIAGLRMRRRVPRVREAFSASYFGLGTEEIVIRGR